MDVCINSAYAIRHWLRLCCPALLALLLASGCDRAPQLVANNGWREFQGTWTAAGNRNTISLDGSRRASISLFNGSLVLAGPSRPAVGFRSEAIVFHDTSTGLVGRAVWTDENGDHIYSELRGEGTRSDNKINGTIVGGSGRYKSVEGTYEFSWQFLIENEEGTVQGQSTGLKGRVKIDSLRARADMGGPWL